MSVLVGSENKQECPYDPQRFPFTEVIAQLINAVEVAAKTPNCSQAASDVMYWKGVAMARDAHVHPSLSAGAVVRRKPNTCPGPFILNPICFDQVFDQAIDDDNQRSIVRAVYIPEHGGWYLQLAEAMQLLFSEKAFDPI